MGTGLLCTSHSSSSTRPRIADGELVTSSGLRLRWAQSVLRLFPRPYVLALTYVSGSAIYIFRRPIYAVLEGAWEGLIGYASQTQEVHSGDQLGRHQRNKRNTEKGQCGKECSDTCAGHVRRGSEPVAETGNWDDVIDNEWAWNTADEGPIEDDEDIFDDGLLIEDVNGEVDWANSVAVAKRWDRARPLDGDDDYAQTNEDWEELDDGDRTLEWLD